MKRTFSNDALKGHGHCQGSTKTNDCADPFQEPAHKRRKHNHTSHKGFFADPQIGWDTKISNLRNNKFLSDVTFVITQNSNYINTNPSTNSPYNPNCYYTNNYSNNYKNSTNEAVLKSNAINGKEYYGHRWVFALKSKVFLSMLYSSSMMETNQCSKIYIDDITPEAFEYLLDYFYYDNAIMSDDKCDIGTYLKSNDKDKVGDKDTDKNKDDCKSGVSDKDQDKDKDKDKDSSVELKLKANEDSMSKDEKEEENEDNGGSADTAKVEWYYETDSVKTRKTKTKKHSKNEDNCNNWMHDLISITNENVGDIWYAGHKYMLNEVTFSCQVFVLSKLVNIGDYSSNCNSNSNYNYGGKTRNLDDFYAILLSLQSKYPFGMYDQFLSNVHVIRSIKYNLFLHSKFSSIDAKIIKLWLASDELAMSEEMIWQSIDNWCDANVVNKNNTGQLSMDIHFFEF